jgi:hypothetical protein
MASPAGFRNSSSSADGFAERTMASATAITTSQKSGLTNPARK